MNRIDQIFADLKSRGGKALMPFLTAGDPDIAATEVMLPAVQQAGASIVELGIPFSDPIADGPVIQASMAHALERGVRVADVFEMVSRVRASLDLGIVAMVSYTIVYRMGLERFVESAARAGIDGFIFPDLSLDEAPRTREVVDKAGLILSMLISPTTPEPRAKEIARLSSGFVYVLSRAGITGEQSELPPDLPERLAALRAVTDLPMTVGFGISNREQVAQVVSVSDAAIVGSAIMRRVAQVRDKPQTEVVTEVEAFVRELAGGLNATAANPR